MDLCPVCSRPYETGMSALRRRSQDHILPRAWKCAGYWETIGAINLRVMCADCNTRRGESGHCLGALACAMAVAADMLQPAEQIIRRWRLPQPRAPKRAGINMRVGPPQPTMGDVLADEIRRRRRKDVSQLLGLEGQTDG